MSSDIIVARSKPIPESFEIPGDEDDPTDVTTVHVITREEVAHLRSLMNNTDELTKALSRIKHE